MSTITKELFEKAVETAHANCTADNCPHADAFKTAPEAAYRDLVMTMLNPDAQINPPLAIYFAGIHVGYRLHQLESEPVNQKDAN